MSEKWATHSWWILLIAGAVAGWLIAEYLL
jgi:hypothetical protein